MDNSSLDQTLPTPVHHRPPQEETQPNPSLTDETVKVSLSAVTNDKNPSSGYEETQAVSIQVPAATAETHPQPVDLTESLAETLPTPVNLAVEAAPAEPSPQVVPVLPQSPSKPVRRKGGLTNARITLFGVLGLILIGLISAFGGYQSGISLRKKAESTQVASQLMEQFVLAQQEMNEKQYERARQRYEYIIRHNPAFPGAADRLAETLLYLNTTATPTIVPTPTLTPTPDTRNVEQKFSQAQQYLANSDWTNCIDTLLMLRKEDASYRPVEIDGMLYLALRNRGRDKIAKLADLEGGIYDLTQASKFGPLDAEAQGSLTWASLYITGVSFWDLDWEQAVYYFGQVAPAMPGLRDGSGMTASERYRQALIGYGDSLATKGDYCAAMAQYEAVLAMGEDADVRQSYNSVSDSCGGGSSVEDQGDQEGQDKPKKTKTPKTNK